MTHQGTPASLCWATENPNMQSSQESRGPFWITRFLVSMLKASLVLIRTRRSRETLLSLAMMKRGCHWGSHWHMDWHLWSHSCLSGSRMIIAILKCGQRYRRERWMTQKFTQIFPPSSCSLISSLHLYLQTDQNRLLHLSGYLILWYKNRINTQSLKMQSQWFTIAQSANNNWILFVNND